MMYYAVIDTNVLISGMLKKPSIPNEILVQALVGNIVPLINEKIMAEYKENDSIVIMIYLEKITAALKFNTAVF